VIGRISAAAVSLDPRPAVWAIGSGLIDPCVPVAMAASLVPAAEIALLPCQELSATIALEWVEIGPVPAVVVFNVPPSPLRMVTDLHSLEKMVIDLVPAVVVFNAPRSPVKMVTGLVQVAAAYNVPTFRIVQAAVAIVPTGPSLIAR
jgi:hypothetical protein